MTILKYILSSFVFIVSSVSVLCASEQTTKERMKADLDVIKTIFEVNYAPKEWKKSQFGWDLNSEIQKAKDKVQSTKNISIKNFQGIVSDFFHSTKDYHVGVTFYSTELSSLPFSVKPIDGKYYVFSVNADSQNCPLSVGDEIVEFDNRPTAEVIQDLIAATTSNSNPATDEEIASMYLTERNGKLGHSVPKESVMIRVKSLLDDDIKTVKLIWNYTPEKISNGFDGTMLATTVKHSAIIGKKRPYDKMMLIPEYSIIKKHPSKAGGSEEPENYIGSRNSFLRSLGVIRWQTPHDSDFQAYIYETKDHKKIGFIRISDYMDDNAFLGGGKVEKFAEIIRLFQGFTDALVIDQMNNPGGSLLDMYDYLSMLTDKPLSVPVERVMITQEEVFIAVIQIQELVEILEELSDILDADDTLLLQNILNYFNFIVSQWDAGKTFTDPCYLLGFDQIFPHPEVRYTKPILVLINSLDFSCADFFPAILQDNKRATLMGSRTAGAGGYVEEKSFPNRHGIGSFSLTGSIAERINGLPIENLGVSPDYEYKFTLDDILFGYQDFADQINLQIVNMLN